MAKRSSDLENAEGEWKVKKHGKSKHKAKIQLAICPDGHDIAMMLLTN